MKKLKDLLLFITVLRVFHVSSHPQPGLSSSLSILTQCMDVKTSRLCAPFIMAIFKNGKARQLSRHAFNYRRIAYNEYNLQVSPRTVALESSDEITDFCLQSAFASTSNKRIDGILTGMLDVCYIYFWVVNPNG